MSSNILHRTIRNAIIALSLLLCLWATSPGPADASILGDFFSFSFEPVVFSKNEISGSETISATVIGKATCRKNLPVSPSEGTVTGSVVARNVSTGQEVILNPGYTVVINPFPKKKGDITETEQVVSLEFPAQTVEGEYNIIGKLTVAKVKIAGIWLDVTDFLPQEELMGSLKYINPEADSAAEPVSATGETVVTPAEEYPVSESLDVQSSAVEPSINTLPWWILLLVPVVLLVIIIVSTIWYLRHRKSKAAVENNI